mmetsp:Transcript_7655/g.22443  ORF Transcript_7655/g.22443 Transcript_7655/m.22443 type:complete len:238 (+) Transcript_7655:877-1590(+)
MPPSVDPTGFSTFSPTQLPTIDPTTPSTAGPTPQTALLSWELHGSPLDGGGSGSRFGSSVSLSRDGTLLAASFGSPLTSGVRINDSGYTNSNQPIVRLFAFEPEVGDDNDWTLEAEALTCYGSGCDPKWDDASVIISGNGEVVVVTFWDEYKSKVHISSPSFWEKSLPIPDIIGVPGSSGTASLLAFPDIIGLPGTSSAAPSIALSHDGRRLAVSSNKHTWIYDIPLEEGARVLNAE